MILARELVAGDISLGVKSSKECGRISLSEVTGTILSIVNFIHVFLVVSWTRHNGNSNCG